MMIGCVIYHKKICSVIVRKSTLNFIIFRQSLTDFKEFFKSFLYYSNFRRLKKLLSKMVELQNITNSIFEGGTKCVN